MTPSEQKRRELLNKWDFRVLRADITDIQYKLDEAISERDDAEEGHTEVEKALEDALRRVWYWFEDFLTLKKPMTVCDSQRIMRDIEKHLGM